MKMKIDETSTNSIEAENNVLITVVTRRSARGKSNFIHILSCTYN